MSGLEILAGLVANKGVDLTLKYLDEKRIAKRAIDTTASYYKGTIPSLTEHLKNWTKSNDFEKLLKSLEKGISKEKIIEDGIDSFLKGTAFQNRKQAEKVLRHLLQSFREELYKSREGHAVMMHRKERMHVELQDYLSEEFEDLKSHLKKKRDEELENIEIKKYDFPPKYIGRTISHLSSVQQKNKSIYSKLEKERLKKVVYDTKRIVLLGDAGSGKSTELRYLAAELSQEESKFIPIFKRLNIYISDQGIKNYLPEYWKKISEDQLILILDGLDEIQPDEFNKVVRQITSFSEKYSELRIIISCRTNFYELPSTNSQGTLSGYEAYFLTDFNIDDVREFYKTKFNEKDAESFITEIFENDLNDLITKPFFVLVLADVYEDNKTLSLSRADLFEQFLFQRMEFDEEHFRTTYNIRPKKREIVELLEKVALSMEILARNYLPEYDLLQLVSSSEFKMLQFSPTFAKKKGEERVWEFEHNNIQEYLAARTLARLSYDNVIQFITFEPSYKRLNPSWLNTLTFLFSLLKAEDKLFQQLLDWLLINEQEVVVKFERDKISKEICNKLFQEIFQYYKDREIWINSNKFNDREFAQFGQTEENLNFLIKEIELEENSRITKLNVIHLIGYFVFDEFEDRKKRQVKDLLLSEARTNADDPYYVNSTINALNHASMHDKDVVEIIMNQFEERNNQYIRAAIYSLLLDSKQLDHHVGYLIEGEKLLNKSDLQGLEDRESNNLIDESWKLKQCFINIKSAKGLVSLYKNLSKERYFEFGYNYDETLNSIIDNSIQAYKKDGKIFEPILDWYLNIVNNFRLEWIEYILRFFDETETKEKAFQVLWNREKDRDQEIITAMAYLATGKSLEFVLEKYSDHDCTNDDIEDLYQRMYRVNNEKHSIFREMIIKETSIQIEEPEPPFDYEKFRKEKKQRDFDLLFKENGLVNSVKIIYQKEEKDVLTEDELFEIRKINNRYTEIDDIYPEPTIRLLRNFARKEQEIAREKVLKWFEVEEHVEWYKVSLIINYLSRNKDIEVKDFQREWIENWCQKHIRKVDFKDAIKKIDDGGISSDRKAIYLWYFLRRFDLDYTKEVLLDMLSFDHFEEQNWVGIEYLVDRLDLKEVEKRIVQNMKEGIEVTPVLENHIQFAVEHEITEVYPIIFEEILNTDRKDYNRAKILNLYLEGTNDIESLKKLLPRADTYIRWKIVEKLYENEHFDFLVGYLKEILDGDYDNEEKVNAAEYLVKTGDLKGLRYYTNWLINNKSSDYHHSRTKCLNNLTVIKALPYLMNLLEFSYGFNESIQEINYLKNNVLRAITRIALENEENYNKVRASLEDFIADKKDAKNVKFLHYKIDEIEQQFYMNKAQSYSIEQVKEKLKLINR